MTQIYDTIIIGGGPAGLSAAKHLAFHKQRVLVIDRKTGPLNYNENPVQNYLGAPVSNTGQTLLRQFQGEAVAMGARVINENVTRIEGQFPDFRVTACGLVRSNATTEYRAKTLLLATGVTIIHPKINGSWLEWLPIAGRARACLLLYRLRGPVTWLTKT